ncbi:Ferric iron ABC transporter, permease protein [Brachybacterium faecium]|uniref:ABC-type Fe3+ transport system, permease component n=1 Tax=Brachybacterium faecium (strain ATCC 43885 / DSM 4810 / JCM 11609 / LMG 19847 / NBRC 14762 / NCIMB 9860 / 6-10) TaxID=446465 RepID=C7MHQ2_BRAFD|nr:ABC transporter permease subunit [Brachybacterium faecium]ACU86569.1 ABC-type Fe3+ transport system, permease component [Brachybacterium faecium DSM 4810]SLM95917.1 Ferric iron ABC transporter, permease protein [Brachybacterium faecium]
MALITLLATAWFAAAFLVLPNIELLTQVFVSDGQASTRAWGRLFGSERAMHSLRNSVVLALTLSVTVNVIGVFIVLATRYFRLWGRRILWLGYATSLIYGGIVMVAGYNFVYGENGILTRLLTTVFPFIPEDWFIGYPAVVFVMTIASTGNHLLFLNAAMARVDHQTVESAQQMGASQWTILRRVVLPTLLPTIFAVTILVFLAGLGALAVPDVIGGRGFQTISPMMLTFANSPESRDLAAALALILALFTITTLLIMNRLERGGTYFSVAKVASVLEPQKIENRFANVVVHGIAYLLLLIYAVPPLLIVIFSFTDARSINSGTLRADSFTLENYRQVLVDPMARWPFMVSIGYSALAAGIVIVGLLFVVRVITRYERSRMSAIVEYALHIPWVMPGTMMALGLLLLYSSPQWIVGQEVLSGTIVILLIAYVVGKIPFTLRLLKAGFAGINKNVEEAAALLGASQFYILRRVILPLVLPTAAAVTALNFNSMLDDYDTAVFLAHPFYQPLGIFIRNATRGETNADATALVFVYSVLLMIIATTTLWLIYGGGAGKILRLLAPRRKLRDLAPTEPADQA